MHYKEDMRPAETLERALLEYIEKYGATDLAKQALALAAKASEERVDDRNGQISN